MNTIEKYLQKLEEQLLQTEFRKHPENVASLLADEFIECGMSGKIYTKKQIIDSLQAEKPIIQTLIDFKSIPLAPTIILVTYKVAQAKAEGKMIYSIRSSIWKLTDSRWQMVYHQGTLLT